MRGSFCASLRFGFGSWGRGQLVSLLLSLNYLLARWALCQASALCNNTVTRSYIIGIGIVLWLKLNAQTLIKPLHEQNTLNVSTSNKPLIYSVTAFGIVS